ncbi:MAG: metal-sensitive transcriptional regulator [Coriobacteriia bacterium]|nr:metal-sensitive transcriptional regulator [Coriobacteriia bacterium]
MTDSPETTVISDEEQRKAMVNRLKRLEGQIRGLQTMIESGQECDAILTQVMAAKSALNQVGLHIIGHAMKNCLIDEEAATREELIDEAIKVFLKYSSCVK